jgi:hypothetical protein
MLPELYPPWLINVLFSPSLNCKRETKTQRKHGSKCRQQPEHAAADGLGVRVSGAKDKPREIGLVTLS